MSDSLLRKVVVGVLLITAQPSLAFNPLDYVLADGNPDDEKQALTIDLEENAGFAAVTSLFMIKPKAVTVGAITNAMERASVEASLIGGSISDRQFSILGIDARLDPAIESKLMEAKLPYVATINRYVRESGNQNPLFKQVNAELRSGVVLSRETQRFTNELGSALMNLPGLSGISFRGVILSTADLGKYQEGERVRELSFTSTSLNPMTALRFAGAISEGDDELAPLPPGSERVVFLISGKSGKLVSYFSEYMQENEVLFRNGTKFNVRKRLPDPASGITYIMMDEI